MTVVSGTNAYDEYKSLLLALHVLVAQNNGSSEQARAIRNRMEFPERSLSDDQMDHLDGLSADLYMLQHEEIFEPGIVSGSDLQSIWKQEQWEEVLQSLRKQVPGLTETSRAYLRAIAYERLGDIDCAYLFMNHAVILDPDDIVFQYFRLEYLMELERFDIAIEQVNVYTSNPDTASSLLILSAAVLIQSVRAATNKSLFRQRFSQAYDVLIHVLSRNTIARDTPAEVVSLGYKLLHLILTDFGEKSLAEHAYELAEQVDPNHETALDDLPASSLTSQERAASSEFRVPTEAANAGPFTATFAQRAEALFALTA